MPKPLVPVGGKALINHVLDRLAAVGVETAVVNVHHFADQIEQAPESLRRAPKIAISDEREGVLGTGGGVAKALPLLGAAPFFHVNSDTLWIDGVKPNLETARHRVPARPDGRAAAACPDRDQRRLCGTRRLLDGARRQAAHAAANARSCPSSMRGSRSCRRPSFGTRRAAPSRSCGCFDRAIEEQRLFGLRLEGVWMHVGSPDAVAAAEAAILASAA